MIVLGALAFPSKLVCYSVEAYISTTGMNDSYFLRINVDGKTEFWDFWKQILFSGRYGIAEVRDYSWDWSRGVSVFLLFIVLGQFAASQDLV